MDMKNNGSACRRIKGFTLVELVVVMAIIAILAGVANLATQSFVRNARRETANDNAHLLFTGFQNILTQCEIKQDNSVISSKMEANTVVKDDTVKYVIIEFKAYNGNVQCYKVSNMNASGSGTNMTSVYNSNYGGGIMKYTDGGTKGSAALPNAIAGIIDASFEGEAKIYIDYENFEVRSVVFKPMGANDRNTTINNFSDGGLKTYAGWFLGFADGAAQETAYDNNPLYGVYPFQLDMGITG